MASVASVITTIVVGLSSLWPLRHLCGHIWNRCSRIDCRRRYWGAIASVANKFAGEAVHSCSPSAISSLTLNLYAKLLWWCQRCSCNGMGLAAPVLSGGLRPPSPPLVAPSSNSLETLSSSAKTALGKFFYECICDWLRLGDSWKIQTQQWTMEALSKRRVNGHGIIQQFAAEPLSLEI